MKGTSKRLFARAQKVLVGGVNSPVRAFRAVGGDPVFIRRAAGPRFWDADGRSYIDYCLSWGPLILGHGRREVIAAARKAALAGSTYGIATEGEVNLGEALQQALPSMELLRLVSSGTEATMSALRVARAYTGRELVIKFTGGYHGHVDSLLVQAGSGATTLGSPDSAGVPKAWARTTLSLPYNNAEAVSRACARYPKSIAAVIVEPVAANMGMVWPREGFLESLREITRRHGALLIFDEVVTGFRLCYGGAQTLFGVKPDLTCLGKIVGGGFPLAAYGGRREIMKQVSPLGPVYQAGTLSGNPVAVAAGLETLRLLKKTNPYARLADLTEYITRGLAQEANKAGVSLRINSTGSMFTPFFCAGPVEDYASAMKADRARYAAFFRGMLGQGVYLPPAQFEAAFLSYSHAASDLDATLRAARRVFQRLAK